MAQTNRREQLARDAADHVLEHGLIGLSLRPLAAAIGTSDRMLLYHFADKDDLVATVLRVSNDDAVAAIRALPASTGVRAAVQDLWAAMRSTRLEQCQRTYVEAAALGLFGEEPYVTVVRQANALWLAALADHLIASGVPEARAGRATALLDAAVMGLLLDLPLDDGPSGRDRVVSDLADAVVVIAQGSA